MQKQAVLVCIVCALAALLTIGITLTLLKRGKNPASSRGKSSMITGAGGDMSGHYQIDKTSTALLTETADAGTDYLNTPCFWAIPTPCACITTA